MNMSKKRFVGCIYLKDERAIKHFSDNTIIDTDPVRLAKKYSDNGVDEIIVYDMSTDDASHDRALDILKDICANVEAPVVGAGNVKRMEDIKKILYTGCKKAALNYEKQSNIDITIEVSQKFGKDKIAVCFSDSSKITENRQLVDEYASELILVDESKIKDAMFISDLELIVTVKDAVTLHRILEYLEIPCITGITGYAIHTSILELNSLKALCKESGLDVNIVEAAFKWSDFKLNSDGMVPCIVQDYKTNEVLMMAYMDETAYNMTVQTGKMTYYSRSRNELWIKGDTSGHYQYVKSLTADCDMDTILAKVSQVGAACHTGSYSCFFNEIFAKETQEKNPMKVFEDVMKVIMDRKENPKEGSYTNYLFDKGIDKILKKLGEEATEIVIAAKNPNANEIKYEISDFLYHMMVLMAEKGVTWEEITAELANR